MKEIEAVKIEKKQIYKKEKSFLKANWMLIVALIYLIFPIDFIPDIIPVVGMFDDAGLLVIELIRRYIVSLDK